MQEQLHGLEGQIAERDTELERLQEQLVQLTEDFRYNLKVHQNPICVLDVALDQRLSLTCLP